MRDLLILNLLILALPLLVWTPAAQAQQQKLILPVEHDHLMGSCRGELIVGADGIGFRSKEHPREWSYRDIKVLTLEHPRVIKIVSYESTWLRLAGDRQYEFRVLEGDLTAVLNEVARSRVGRILVTNLVAAPDEPLHTIPARHRHRFGGCQGTIRLFSDRMTYEAADAEDSRLWRFSDIRSVSRSGPYSLSIVTFEPQLGGPTRTFSFDLKDRLDDGAYDFLWSRINEVVLPASPSSRLASAADYGSPGSKDTGPLRRADDTPATDAARSAGGIQSVEVALASDGYLPATVQLKAGIPARLTVIRRAEASCGTEIVIPDFNIRQTLPFSEPVVIEFTPRSPGEFGFACGMGMLRGKIVVR
jgi:hypothetical protein